MISTPLLWGLVLRVRVGLWYRASLATRRVVPASRAAISDACPGCARASPSACVHVSRLPVRSEASETAGKRRAPFLPDVCHPLVRGRARHPARVVQGLQ